MAPRLEIGWLNRSAAPGTSHLLTPTVRDQPVAMGRSRSRSRSRERRRERSRSRERRRPRSRSRELRRDNRRRSPIGREQRRERSRERDRPPPTRDDIHHRDGPRERGRDGSRERDQREHREQQDQRAMPPPAPRGPGPCFKARSHAALCLGRLGRRCRRLAVAFVGLQLLPGDGTAACLWQCGEEGHIARDCPTAPPGGGGGGRGPCYKCGEEGHIARDCPNPEAPGGGGGPRRRRGGGEGGEENMAWGKPGEQEEDAAPDVEVDPEFGLSGALAAETNKVKQSCYLFGRERRVADVPTDHPSCSKQHAVLQYRMTEKEGADGMMKAAVRPYLMDLGSTNGTFLNGERLEAERYYELLETDMLKFGNSSREYVLVKEKMGEPGIQRVKVYRLNEEGLWDDKGTGHVSVELMEGNSSVGLVVMGEGEGARPLLIHRISKENQYQRQGDDTIITWTDPEIGTDIALSFQEARGCNYIWEQVLHVQESSSPRGGSPGSPYGPRALGGGGQPDDFDVGGQGRYDEMGPGMGPVDPGSSGAVELPEPELSSLKEIARALTEVSLFQRDRIAQQLTARRGYLGRLLELFRMCEDLEDEESLLALFDIFKQSEPRRPPPSWRRVARALSSPRTALLDSSDSGLQEQVGEMLKMLLDPETLEGSAEKNKFVELFYDKYIAKLLATLVQAGDDPYAAGGPSANTVGLVVDLLCFCVVSHSYRIKYYILRNNVVEKVLKLLKCKERWLVVAAVRFLRTALSMKDEFYNRYLIKNHLLGPVVAAFLDNGPRYNLLNSACLELFEFIRKENLKGLLAELMDQHWEQLQGIDYCEVFQAMHIRHEQNQDHVAPGGEREGDGEARAAQEAELAARQRAAAAAEQRRRRGEREVDADEESYFDREGDSDEDEAQAGGGRVMLESASPLPGLLGPLVDYGDEDEDDTLPLRAASTPKRSPAADRPGSPPLEKRFRPSSAPGAAGVWAAQRQSSGSSRGSPPLR
ncbi:hypothetical protein CHLNCDRAFT_58505 [Chlorella variabilis]|uniref:Serine/threonine-protein phosphatase 4 regulatory subunit 3-like central domain-containing protein n=1 Tax=Chlorella variabilis TaxID=554065 RepID=E1ZKP2_CHLVA|nr:hypothetical protein CHLNCDRAFT_58505 [Chlorella variabilis]EFN53416.1 hypothetical protein CHLNCDRAFT_58505 [Chlorella variabilis]|eukprot:XP_005845518.1 hypothetical protein CHLNCDRAFT_58505 [Chlorella variabilis]